VNIMKGYMESAKFSRGKEKRSRRWRYRSWLATLTWTCQHQQRGWASFRPTAARDATRHRFHGPHPRLPARLGFAKSKPRSVGTDHFGLVSDFLSECWNQLRAKSRQNFSKGAFTWACASGPTQRAFRKPLAASSSWSRRTQTLPFPTRLLGGRCGSRRVSPAGSRSSKNASVPLSFVTPSSATRWVMTGWKVCAPRPSYTAKQHWQRSSPPGRLGLIAPGSGDENQDCNR